MRQMRIIMKKESDNCFQIISIHRNAVLFPSFLILNIF